MGAAAYIDSSALIQSVEEMTMNTATRRAETPVDPELNAYNAAFYALGLRWHWDVDTFAALQAFACPIERIRRYLETRHPHLLKAYDPEFLASAIETRKTRPEHAANGYFDWAAVRAGEVGI
jgi:hypothetical protein